MMKLGILGGGQLGRMLLQAAGNYTLETFVLENDPTCPAAHLCHHFTLGDIRDYDTVYAFGKQVEVLTIEIENINIDALFQLQKEGIKVIPSPEAIAIIKDKGIQKQFYADNNIPTAPFLLTDDKTAIEANGDFLPAANKLRTGGYDGKGVELLFGADDLSRAFTEPSLLEKMVNIKKEIAVLVGVGLDGTTVVYSPTEMVFDPKLNLVDYLIAPADISAEQIKTVETIALQAVKALQSPGLFAVELFLSTNDEILVNEIAPRAHNSGHQTIEGNLISQYDMQLRIFQQLPLGLPTNRGFSAMYNLIGEAGSQGNTMYQGLDQALAIEGVFVHQYGKSTTKPGRKMGHVTIVDNNKASLLEKLSMVKRQIHVIGDKAIAL
jgi:5-(carboxyamino)imidazole ribonucleotide synthase